MQELVGKPSDVFSSGIILIQLLFPTMSVNEIVALKTSGKAPKHNLFPHLSDLAEKMT